MSTFEKYLNEAIAEPEEIKSIWDNEGETADQYTVILNSKTGRYYDSIGLSSNPGHPQGFSQWGEALEGNHLGKKITWNKLPDNVKRHVIMRLKDE